MYSKTVVVCKNILFINYVDENFSLNELPTCYKINLHN